MDWQDEGVADGLPTSDRIRIGQLKKFRRRSLSNPRYRDAEATRRRITFRSVVASERESAVKQERESASQAIRQYEAAKKKGDPALEDECWRRVLQSVDHLIDSAEAIQGESIAEM
jgi:hypothetical protein